MKRFFAIVIILCILFTLMPYCFVVEAASEDAVLAVLEAGRIYEFRNISDKKARLTFEGDENAVVDICGYLISTGWNSSTSRGSNYLVKGKYRDCNAGSMLVIEHRIGGSITVRGDASAFQVKELQTPALYVQKLVEGATLEFTNSGSDLIHSVDWTWAGYPLQTVGVGWSAITYHTVYKDGTSSAPSNATVNSGTGVKPGDKLIIKVNKGYDPIREVCGAYTVFSGQPYYLTIDGEKSYPPGSIADGDNNQSEAPFVRLRKWIEEFSYAGSDDTDVKVWKEQIYYDDYYFSNDSYTYNHELATMSLALAMSAFNSKEAKANNYSAESAGKNVKALLNNAGFKDIDITSYAGKPTQDSIGVAFGHKKVEDGSTLIAVAVRGGGYESEWAGNFDITGYVEHHDGFDKAQGTALSKLGAYVKGKGINGPIKIWIVGYSRGAATANLLSATLHNSGLKAYTTAVTLQEKDIYTYTFATPQNTNSSYVHDAMYYNIFNIINPNDFVPKVALTDWEYSRYGIDLYIPSSELNKEVYESLSPKTLERFKAVIGNATFGGAAYVNLPQIKEQSSTFDRILHDLHDDIGNEKSASSQRILKAIREIMLTINDSDDKSKYELAMALVSASKNAPELKNLVTALIQASGNPVDSILDSAGELYYIFNIIGTAHNPGLYLAWMLTTNEQTLFSADKPSSWAVDQVNAAIDAKLVPQSLQSKYTQATTRAEFCALAVALYETVTGREITGRTTFTDTTDVNVQKMAYLGVVNGIGDNKFGPGNKLTREQAATMLSRLADAIGKPLSMQNPAFSDNANISSWAFDAVGQMQATGIMGGVGNNTFAPKSDYTREQSIITMMRLFNIVK